TSSTMAGSATCLSLFLNTHQREKSSQSLLQKRPALRLPWGLDRGLASGRPLCRRLYGWSETETLGHFRLALLGWRADIRFDRRPQIGVTPAEEIGSRRDLSSLDGVWPPG